MLSLYITLITLNILANYQLGSAEVQVCTDRPPSSVGRVYENLSGEFRRICMSSTKILLRINMLYRERSTAKVPKGKLTILTCIIKLEFCISKEKYEGA